MANRDIRNKSAKTLAAKAQPASLVQPLPAGRSWLGRLLWWRRPPAATTFQRCLAVHMHYSGPRGGLS